MNENGMRDIQNALADTPKKESPSNYEEREKRAKEREKAYERKRATRQTRLNNVQRQWEGHKDGVNSFGRKNARQSSWIEAGFSNGSLRVVDVEDDSGQPSSLCCW